ncbi:MAG: hypothetical protein GTO53_07270 [Planctomycetales bacterium]|nr:hypothetical protein [Planctomycetales bacterium]NIM08935.1 hypothetical protein [Planctomycetales bacterium]NIN08405.1 hypothetical protein [Planctomycetales bacterium]NIN77533.1 hypothetical protein [Planctomycetales bacterium]NIO34705.1 hypothetical protein [Planctomycetales bacterium]
MKICAEKEGLHVWLRRVYFMAAGTVACLVLAGMALQAFQIEWPTIGITTAIGILASTTDVLACEQNSSHKVRSTLFWLCGFALLCFVMWIGLLIPYFILAAISIVFGVWQNWETVGPPGNWLPIPIGAAFGLLIWHLLDDY